MLLRGKAFLTSPVRKTHEDVEQPALPEPRILNRDLNYSYLKLNHDFEITIVKKFFHITGMIDWIK